MSASPTEDSAHTVQDRTGVRRVVMTPTGDIQSPSDLRYR